MGVTMETEAPPAEIAAALERLRVEMRYLKDEVRELKEADRERAKASRALTLAFIFSFLAPTAGVVWGYAQLTARVDQLMSEEALSDAKHGDHEQRIRALEKVRP